MPSSSSSGSSRPRPPPPAKPAHLARLSFPRPLSAAAPSFDSAHQASAAFLASSQRTSVAGSSIAEGASEGELEGAEGTGTRTPTTDRLGWEDVEGQDAWTVWSFQGLDAGELSSVPQGSRIQVLAHRLASPAIHPPHDSVLLDEGETGASDNEGWSLARLPMSGEIGLIPQSYFTYLSPAEDTPQTSDMLPKSVALAAPLIQPAPSVFALPRTPSPPPSVPLQPQATGETALSRMVRTSLFAGRTLNRYSAFVTAGAEEFILSGPATGDADEGKEGGGSTPKAAHARLKSTDSHRSAEEYKDEACARGVSEADLHFVDSGPRWKAKTPPFRISVHSPQKRKSLVGLSEYTIYYITSIFTSAENRDQDEVPEITVERRFSNFVTLAEHLSKKFAALALPPLPEKNLAGRFSADFVETRRGDLERWLRRVARHPVLRYADALVGFLGMEDEEEWVRLCPSLERDSHVGPLFYSNIFHPAFNVDLEDALDAIERFEGHVAAADRGIQGLRETFAKLREGAKDDANLHRMFAYRLQALITSRRLGEQPIISGLPSASDPVEDEPEHRKGLVNGQGSWCFREECTECLSLTMAMQAAAECLADVADINILHANGAMLRTQEGLKDVAHPAALYTPVIETHRMTLDRYADLLHEADRPPDGLCSAAAAAMDAAGRCETVLNSTLAEMVHWHDSKAEDFRHLTTEYLNGEIARHEAALEKLKAARAAFEGERYQTGGEDGPRRLSQLDEQLADPARSMTTDLRQPSPHLNDYLVRPVAAAAASAFNGSVSRLLGVLPGESSKRLSRWLW